MQTRNIWNFIVIYCESVCKIWIETYVQNYIKKEIYHGDPKVLKTKILILMHILHIFICVAKDWKSINNIILCVHNIVTIHKLQLVSLKI